MKVVVQVKTVRRPKPRRLVWEFRKEAIIIQGEYVMLTLSETDPMYTFKLILKDSKGREVPPDGPPDYSSTALNGVVDLFLDPGNQSGKVTFLDGPGTAQLSAKVLSLGKELTAVADITCLPMSAATAEFEFTKATP